MADTNFIHLRSHSAYSLLEGAIPVDALISLAVADGQPALGLVDNGNLFGALEFSEKSVAAGLQPIIGSQLALAPEGIFGQSSKAGSALVPQLVVLAATEQGYENLMWLVSRSFFQDDDGLPSHISIDLLAEASDGLIVLTGGYSGPVNLLLSQGQSEKARQTLEQLSSILPDRLYVELQRHRGLYDRGLEGSLIELADSLDLPLVATNEPFFASRDDFAAHDALIAISQGSILDDPARKRLSEDYWFKPQGEMCKLFADLPEAIGNTIEIARRCAVRPRERKAIFPQFVEGVLDDDSVAEAEVQLLRKKAEDGLKWRLQEYGLAPGISQDTYWDRLAFELNTLEEMNFPGYFLIVADFIQWAKSEGIPVGPGRGSGAGSLVAYALTITDLDPMRFALLFERFLNPERVSLPDFDIDFCQDRREEVIRYVQEKYGHDHVAQIITFGSLQARAVLRDVGRVLQIPYGQVDRLCKMVPANPVTLAEAIESEPRIQVARDQEPIIAQLLDYSLKLEGLYRHASTHAAGIVIGDRPLDKLVPLYRDPRSEMPVTQFNMKWVEKAGLVKFDFLGLKTLTVLVKAVELIAKTGPKIELGRIPLDNAETFHMLSQGESVGVFQLESAGMRRALLDMKPDRFEDIIALVALYRPGPMANIPVYCARKHGREKPTYVHEDVKPILEETFGVIVYQEQVMQIAQKLAGASLGQADLLRRAMGKKIKSEMDAQRTTFVEGAGNRGIAKKVSNAIFDLLAKFAEYGFNKSHAAAYALVAYQTAYLKAQYPVEFLAGSMTLDMGNTDKISDFCREAERLGHTVVAPTINRSGVEFDVEDGEILYALSAIKGVGRQAVEHIVKARGETPFADLADFVARINPRQINRRVLEGLICAGAFQEFEPNRALLASNADRILSAAQRASDTKAAGQSELFGNSVGVPELNLAPASVWSLEERLQREFAVLGFYFADHPLNNYEELLSDKGIEFWDGFCLKVKAGQSAGKIAGTVTQHQERRTRTGGRMGVLQMSDPSGQYEAVIFSEQLASYRDLLEPGSSVILTVGAEDREEGVHVRVQAVEILTKVVYASEPFMRIYMNSPEPISYLRNRLQSGGEGQVNIVVLDDIEKREIEVSLPGHFQISRSIGSAIKAVPGVVAVDIGRR